MSLAMAHSSLYVESPGMRVNDRPVGNNQDAPAPSLAMPSVPGSKTWSSESMVNF